MWQVPVFAFSNSIGSIVEVGGNLIKSLWQGISDAGKWLWDQISGFFGGIVKGIKSFFGIHSPSTRFANFGEYMEMCLGEDLRSGTMYNSFLSVLP